MILLVLFFEILALASTKGEVCYGKYGCFNNDYPFNRAVDILKPLPVPLPQSPDQVGTTFHVITKSGNVIIDDSDVTKLQASSYDGQKKTIMVIHGYTENLETSKWLNDLKDALLDYENANLIIVEWKEGAAKIYTTSVANTRLVGAQIAVMIKFLNTQTGNSPSSFHLIGFSLGAQVAGYAGRRLQSVKLGRITGLDPAGPYYYKQHTALRLDASDAAFVDVIHTDTDAFGLITPCGHIDFYPNGGRRQRGCGLDVACDHSRATQYYIDSVKSCSPKGYMCPNWDEFTRGKCMSCQSGCPEMGHSASNMQGVASGSFYLYTNEQSPFCVQSYLYVTFDTSPGSWRDWLVGGKNAKIRIFGTNGNSGKIELEKRELKGGSTELFVAPLKANLGTLTNIEVWNDVAVVIGGWKLKQVTIQFVVGGQRYYGCYDKRIGLSAVKESLKSDNGNC